MNLPRLLLYLPLCGCTADSVPLLLDTGTYAADTSSPGATVDMSLLTGPLVIYAVRHAEKETEGEDPGLTVEGQARALALVTSMRDVPLAAAYATDLRRTQDTVSPTADDHGLPVTISLDPEAGLAAELVATRSDQTVLHAGHSYTLPDFFSALGLDPAPWVSGYGQLWRIALTPGAAPTVEETRFGATGTGDTGDTGDTGA